MGLPIADTAKAADGADLQGTWCRLVNPEQAMWTSVIDMTQAGHISVMSPEFVGGSGLELSVWSLQEEPKVDLSRVVMK